MGQLVSLCLLHDPDTRPDAQHLLTSEFITDDTIGQEEVGLEILSRVDIKPELRSSDVKDAKDRQAAKISIDDWLELLGIV